MAAGTEVAGTSQERCRAKIADVEPEVADFPIRLRTSASGFGKKLGSTLARTKIVSMIPSTRLTQQFTVMDERERRYKLLSGGWLGPREQIYFDGSSFVDEDGSVFKRASYVAPAGRIEGTMELDRQFQVQIELFLNYYFHPYPA